MITVAQLFNECMIQMNKGNSDKKILISQDDEGNGYHRLLYCFTDDLQPFFEFGDLPIEKDELKDFIILG